MPDKLRYFFLLPDDPTLPPIAAEIYPPQPASVVQGVTFDPPLILRTGESVVIEIGGSVPPIVARIIEGEAETIEEGKGE